jgi:hypothetical protein
VGNLPIIQQWIKSWKNTNIVKKERFVEIWDAGLLLAFFTILRTNEFANLNKQSIIQQDNGVFYAQGLKQLMTSLLIYSYPKWKILEFVHGLILIN